MKAFQKVAQSLPTHYPAKGQPGLVRFPDPPYGLSSQSGDLTKPGPTNDNEKDDAEADDADDADDDKE